MTDGPDERLTTTRQLIAILSVSVRPDGKVNGTLRHETRSYRFSGLPALPGAVARWLTEVTGSPAVVDEPPGPGVADPPPADRPDEEKPCR